jgi:hypothetical protein
MAKGKIFACLTVAFFLTGCSVTVGTVHLSQGSGEDKLSSEITQEKPVTVETEAQVPVSAIP